MLVPAGWEVWGSALNESPSEKEGKLREWVDWANGVLSLNESPSEKEGKCLWTVIIALS